MTNDSKQSSWRFELKYRINTLEYNKLRIAIRPFMKCDYFTQIAPPEGYLVRSLYYDTYDYKLYHEKMNGDHERIKFRLRSYSKEINGNSVIRAEMKVRRGNAMEKHGVLITMDEYLFFINKKCWPENTNPVLNEFERYRHLWALEPQILVQYFREGYEDRVKDGIRITFDHKVCALHSDTLFPTNEFFYRSLQHYNVVMEIKCRNNQPVWLRDLIRNYGLRWVANSKYTQSIQSARNDLYYPNGVVIVR